MNLETSNLFLNLFFTGAQGHGPLPACREQRMRLWLHTLDVQEILTNI